MIEAPETEAVTDRICTLAREVYSVLGGGYNESVYEHAMAIEMRRAGIVYQRQSPKEIFYKGETRRRSGAGFLGGGQPGSRAESVRLDHEGPCRAAIYLPQDDRAPVRDRRELPLSREARARHASDRSAYRGSHHQARREQQIMSAADIVYSQPVRWGPSTVELVSSRPPTSTPTRSSRSASTSASLRSCSTIRCSTPKATHIWSGRVTWRAATRTASTSLPGWRCSTTTRTRLTPSSASTYTSGR